MRNERYSFKPTMSIDGVFDVCLDLQSNKKNPRGIRPRRFCPSPRVQNILRSLKIRALTYVAKDATSINYYFVWPSEYRRSGASDNQKKIKQEKPLGALDSAVFPLPSGCKFITVTQDMCPSGIKF